MATFTLAGETFALVDSKLTFAEAAAFEKVTGILFAEAMEDERLGRSALAIQATLWLSMKRVRPELKFSDLDSLSIDDIEWDSGEADDEPDPTAGEDSQPTG